MVTEISPKFNIGTQIGSALGSGLQSGMTRAAEQQFKRTQLQNALGQIENITPQNTNAFQLFGKLSHALAGIEGGDKYLSTAFPLLLNQLAREPGTGTGGETGAQPEAGAQPKGAGGLPKGAPKQPEQIAKDFNTYYSKFRQEAPDIPEPEKNPDIFGQELDPTALGMGPFPKIYSNDQIEARRKELDARGIDSTYQVSRMQEYNDRARQEVADMINAAKTQSDISQMVTTRQGQFRTALQNELGISDPDDLAVAERIAYRPEYKNIANDKLRANAVKKEFDQYKSTVDEFTRGSQRQNFFDEGEKNRQMKTLKAKADILKKYGQFDKAKSLLQKGSWSPVETDMMINPLDESIEKSAKSLEKIPKKQDILEQVTVLPDDPEFEKQLQKAMKNNEEIDKKRKPLIEKFILNNFKTGTVDPRNKNVISPGTSLLLLRNKVIESLGGDWKEFDSIITDLVNEGKIQLDPSQESDFPLIGQHPAKAVGPYEYFLRSLPFYNPRKT